MTPNVLALHLIREATQTVGGSVAWSRMGTDARVDAVRARAWLMVASRVDGAQKVRVDDIDAAMVCIYDLLS